MQEQAATVIIKNKPDIENKDTIIKTYICSDSNNTASTTTARWMNHHHMDALQLNLNKTKELINELMN